MKKRKLLSFLTALAMILSLMPANLAFADAADLTDETTGQTLKDEDGNGYYEIATADALTAFANLVNGGQNTINAELTADIDLGGIDESGNGITEKAWTPIGNNSTQFKGEFDGGNKTIKGLYINNTGDYQGLFGYIYGGTVKDLTVEGSVKGGFGTGGIVGLIKVGVTITNCEYRGSVEGSDDVGGIVGYVTYVLFQNNPHSTITGCRNYGTVTGTADSGTNVGGIVGSNSDGDITQCYNAGTVTGKSLVGGIVGYNSYNNNTNKFYPSITECRNKGTITGEASVGGIAGQNYNDTITKCYNAGTIKATTEKVGGIVGNNRGTINTSYNTGKVSGESTVGGIAGSNESGKKIESSYNAGKVSSTGENVGAIVGTNDGTCSNCYYLENMGAEGTGTKITAEQLAQESTFVGWDFTSTWEIQTGGGYRPTLLDNKEVLHSETYPKLIRSLADLEALYSEVKDGTSYEGKFIKLTKDIDMSEEYNSESGESWTPIGNSSNPFKGTFDGDGYSITGLYINNTSDYQGLFGYIYGGTVKNLTVEGSVTVNNHSGGIVGVIKAGGTIANCEYRGSVEGKENVGGIVGYVTYDRTVDNYTHSTITGCRNYGSVKGTDSVGCIAGTNLCGDITQCYNVGTVTGGIKAGGIVGYNNDNNSKIQDCYNIGTVTGEDKVGGIAGINTMSVANCYNYGNVSSIGTNVGAIVGENTGTCSKCYYLENTGAEGEGTKITAEQLAQESTFVGWDFTNTWEIQTGGGYRPTLRGNKEVLHSETYPKLISSLADLDAWRIESIDNTYEGKFIKLTADIDMSEKYNSENGSSWNSIGSLYCKFMGTFDGNGHSIKGLYINAADLNARGLFGYIDEGGTVKNLTVYGSVTGNKYVGGIVGYNDHSVTITNCEYIGSVTGNNYVGGIAGYNFGYDCKITNCRNKGTVTSKGGYAGGIVGRNASTIEYSYNAGKVSSTSDYAGGIAGQSSSGTIQYCYNTGKVSGTDYVGGIAGQSSSGTIQYCYNMGSFSGSTNYCGGIAGENNDTITSCYYLDNISRGIGQTTDADGVVKQISENEFETGSAFSDWDFENTWEIQTGGGYRPTLLANKEVLHSETYPKLIKKLADLEALRSEVNNGTASYEGKFIKLTNGIDLSGTYSESGTSWTPIGSNSNPFKGTFDGDGYSITGLYINAPSSDDRGLFGYINEGGTVKNLTVEGTVSGASNVGIIAGYNNGTIENCRNAGTVNATTEKVGGIAGTNNGTITKCSNICALSSTSDYAGGIAGFNYGTINTSYNAGAVSGTDYVGGIAGENESTIENCYNISTVSGTDYVGGIAGENSGEGTIEKTYNVGKVTGTGTNVGAIVGLSIPANVVSCYYLDTCITKNNGLGTVIAEEDFDDKTNFSGWNFENIWEMQYFGYRPTLRSNGEVLGSETYYISINSLAKLETFCGNVNSGNTYEGKFIKLTAEIDMSGKYNGESGTSWTPIGTESKQFNGNFNGNGHTIKGLYINEESSDDLGLFGYIGYGGTVKNLTVEGTVSGASNVGIIAGYNFGTIENCRNAGTVNAASENVGGIAGYNRMKIINCNNVVTVNGTSNVGGIAGYNDSNLIENCHNGGTVNATSEKVGGIVGYNKGTINTNYNTGKVSGNKFVGGIAGLNPKKIANCYNVGRVAGGSYAGGISGYNVEGSTTGTVEYCYNVGKISGDYVGGISYGGYNVTSCYRLEGTGGSDAASLSEAQFKALSNFDSWSETIWEIRDGGYRPTLKNNIELLGCESYPELIRNDEDLKTFRNNVNDGNTYEGKFFKLKANIDLGGIDEGGNGISANEWTPIGSKSNPFKGGFDGNGHSITGLYINGTGDYQGLFGYIGEGGTVKNLTVGGSVTGKSYVGSIAGASYGTIENCLNTALVTATSNAGGIAGMSSVTIKNCLNTASVAATSCVGGIVGTKGAAGTVENCYYKGAEEVTGYNEYGTPKTEAELASGEVAYLLQKEQADQTDHVWGQLVSGETKDAYPVLSSDSEKKVYKVDFMIGDKLHTSGYANYNKAVFGYPEITDTVWVDNDKILNPGDVVTADMTVHAVGYSVKYDEGKVVISTPYLGNCTIIIASYSGDSLLDVKSDDITFGNWCENCDITDKITGINELKTDGADKIKVFLWNNLTDRTPKCDFAVKIN